MHPSNQHYELKSIKNENIEITQCINAITSRSNSILTEDINAHTTLWYSRDYRGHFIAEILQNLGHVTFNIYRHSYQLSLRQKTPDITKISSVSTSKHHGNYTVSSVIGPHPNVHCSCHQTQLQTATTQKLIQMKQIRMKQQRRKCTQSSDRILIISADKHHIPKRK